MVESHIRWPNLGSLCVLVVGGLPKSLLGTVEKRKSRFCGYNFKKVRSSTAATVKLKSPFALFNSFPLPRDSDSSIPKKNFGQSREDWDELVFISTTA